MLTIYFKRRATVAAYHAGPAGAYFDQFTAWLAKRGYGCDAVRHLLRGATEFATWVQAPRSGLPTLPSGCWRDFCAHLDKQKRLHGTKGQHSIYWRGAQQFVEFLRAEHGIVAVDAPEQTVLPELVVAFECWMAIHRGIKPSSLDTYRPHVLDLLATLGDQPDYFCATSLRVFVLGYAKRGGRASARTRVKATRMFCRFLIATRRCQPGLDAAVPDIAEWRLASLPRYLPPDDIERVLAACDGTRPIDMRDKAILRKRAAAPPINSNQDRVDVASGNKESIWLLGQVGSFSKVSLNQRSGSRPFSLAVASRL